MSNPRQLSFEGIPGARVGSFNVYHDESGTDPTHARFLFHGILLAPEEKCPSLVARLASARGGFTGRIHFAELRDRTMSERASATARWLDLWFQELSFDCPYKCLVIDRNSRAFDADKYSQHHDLYNHAAGMALTGAVAWSLAQYDRVRLALYSEERTLSAHDPSCSSLPQYLISRIARRRLQGQVRYPHIVQPLAQVTMVPGDPGRVDSGRAEQCEFVQLTDGLTGAVAQAVNASASSEVKLGGGQDSAQARGTVLRSVKGGALEHDLVERELLVDQFSAAVPEAREFQLSFNKVVGRGRGQSPEAWPLFAA